MRTNDRSTPHSGPDRESVWDYPRPPRVERTSARIQVVVGGEVVIATSRAYRVLETSHPPTYYLPVADAKPGSLVSTPGTSWCEFKGLATYLDVVGGGRVGRGAAWTYRDPQPGYEMLRGHVTVYPALVDACTVDGETVRPQPGDFYGGWITDAIAGPFKGSPGSVRW